VLAQMAGGNRGFVNDYADAYPRWPRQAGPEQWKNVMRYYALDQLPAMHELGRKFMVCDRWFSSVPGPTWTNRLFAHSGTSQGFVEMPAPLEARLNLHPYDQETIFDLFDEEGLDWRIYWDDFALSLLAGRLRSLDRIKRHFREFEDHWEQDVRGPASRFPRYVFIEPNYLGSGQNDDHPPCSAIRGEELIARVYDAIRANEELWSRTLLVLVFDEHGGFYDHVEPERALPPGDGASEFTFDRYGIRVPAILVSPWVSAGVFHETLDHTSILRFVIDHFGLGNGRLGRRVDRAVGLGGALNERARPREDVPERLERLLPPRFPGSLRSHGEELEELSDLQQSIVILSAEIERRLVPEHRRVEAFGAAMTPSDRRRRARERMRRIAAIAHESS
jgi:phospholipase C